MTPSLRLLLEDFLGLMREEGELDVFLPLLLSGMGHEIVYRAQKGTRQYGVDISSVGRDADGRKTLFLWLVKCGDIGRRDWDTGAQSVRQSINDVGDTYLRTHVPPQHARLPKKLVILTNGDFNPALSLTITSFIKRWSNDCGVAAETVNGSTLAAWTERYLLDENVLSPGSRALFRRMLANVGSPELSISVGRTLFDELVKSAIVPEKSPAARMKRQLTALRGIRTAISVLQVWAKSEHNLLAPYRLAEYAILCVWSEMHPEIQRENWDVANEFSELLLLMANAAMVYHEQMKPYCLTEGGFARALPDSLLITDAVFVELGRLGLQGCIWAFHAVEGNDPTAHGFAVLYLNRLVALLKSHSCSQSPAYDHHAADIHAGMLLLLIGNCREEAERWLRNVALRLVHVSNVRKYWPQSASFEETLLVRHGYEEISDESMSTSTLVPLLLLWASALEMNDVYSLIRERVLPAIPRTTLNFWSSDIGFDNIVDNPVELRQHGVGEAVSSVPDSPAEFLKNIVKPLSEVEPIERAAWYQLRAAYVPLLASLHWRLQVPREMLVKQVMAVAGYKGQNNMGNGF
jgi:hypothetical protein